jgi:hypothetical protein
VCDTTCTVLPFTVSNTQKTMLLYVTSHRKIMLRNFLTPSTSTFLKVMTRQPRWYRIHAHKRRYLAGKGEKNQRQRAHLNNSDETVVGIHYNDVVVGNVLPNYCFLFFSWPPCHVGGVSLCAYFEGLIWFEPSAVSHRSFCVVPHLVSSSPVLGRVT